MLGTLADLHRRQRIRPNYEELSMAASSAADTLQAFPRTFVPRDFNLADPGAVESIYRSLLERPIQSPLELEKWLADFSELTSAVDEYGNRLYINKSCHTEDAQIEKSYLHFVERIEPKVKPLFFALQKKFLDSPYRAALASPKISMVERRWRADVEIFREQNVPLETEVTRQVTEHDRICGAMTVRFAGPDGVESEHTLQQMGRFLEVTDRSVRQRAWETIANRRLQDRQKLEEIFDRLLGLRTQIATNAGFDNYRSYIWKAYKRFDYTPDDCLRFADAIAQACVPLVDKLDERRKADLGLPALRPWDRDVDPRSRPPLTPFGADQSDALVDRTREIFSRLSPALAQDFDTLRLNNNLDLQSRRGKQPGGYQCSLDEARQPFIFMNAAGLQRDVEVLLHEGGHAFHCIATRQEPLVFLRGAPMEFCEVASMSMELLGADHFDVFYPPADAARAKRTMLENIIGFFPWMTTIDSFQHWLYTHPGHTPAQRTAHWLELMARFGHKLDWSGYEAVRDSSWQRQLHLFHAPFYYIEYGIAQLGALQVWLKSRQDPRQALANYRAALALGGSKPLPELFKAAGIEFDFSARTLVPLMNAIGEELETLPR
jgi:oligoendopeptidase F